MSKYLFSLLLTLFVAVPVSQAASLQVVSATPKENFSGGRSAVSITFNQPVAALSENNAFAAEQCPLQITPTVKGTCRLVGTQTLQFEPAENWTPATSYQVTLPAGFASQVSGQKLAADYTWSFTTPRPYIRQVIPADQEQWIGVRPLIYITASQPIELISAQQAITVTYPASSQTPSWWERLKAYIFSEPLPTEHSEVQVPLTLRRLTEQEYQEEYSYLNKDQLVVAELQQDLPVHSPITVKVSTALRGQKGSLGPEQDFASVFYTYPALQIAGANVAGCLPFDAHIDFTSPVRLADLMKHITVSPNAALAEISEQEAQTLGYQRFVPEEIEEQPSVSHPVQLPTGTGYFVLPLSFLHLSPQQTVTLTIDKDLTDIYGQKLGQEKTFTITNTGYCPAVVYKEGMGVLESYLPARQPIDVLNEPELEVYAARFGKDDFISFAEKNIPYCQQAEISHANVQYNGKYPFQITPDKTKKTYLDLKKFNPTSHNSIIFSQVRVPSPYREDGFCWVGATDNITDMGVTLKTSLENTIVWATSLQTAEPQANMRVELKDATNHTLWTGSTDANGLAVAPGWKELQAKQTKYWMRPVIYAFVSSPGGDAVLASNWNDGIEPWRFDLNFEYNPEQELIRTAFFTDRGIYRPGEMVYFKAITRELKKGQWQLPASTQATVTLYNSRGEEIEKRTFRYQAGAFDGKFQLPADATTGTWQVYVKPDNTSSDEIYSFQVEAVKQADFEVHLRSLQPAYTGGQTAEFMASADYLFGAPVAQGKAKWTVRRANDWFEPEGYDGYIFTPYFLLQNEDKQEGVLVSSSGELDGQGKINFTVPLPQVTRQQTLFTEVGVQAPTGQQLFARSQTTLNPAEFYLGAHMDRWAVEQGDSVQANILAVNLQGKRVGPVQVKADIVKEEYFSIRKMGLAGRLEWVSQRNRKKIASQTFEVGLDGYDFSFLPQQPGTYQITLSAKDKQGHQVLGGFSVTVYGKGEVSWKQHDDDILMLKPEQTVYDPGDTARILVQSPYETATALVSVERERVLDTWTTTISGGADYIDIPIKSSYTPNVFVSVTLVRGRAEQAVYDKEGLDLAKPQGKTGYVQLVISQQDREIKTAVVPTKKQYRPGEEITVKLTTEMQGKPIPAEVTFMAVDEGVLALTGYQVPNLLKVFYKLRPLSVLTANNRLFLIGQRNFGEKGENRGGGGGLSGKLGGVDLRSHFEFTPYFNAQVRTNEKGKAEVKFKLPDNLTTFRLMAVAATVQEFGAAEATVQVSKPLMITPKMPRFARQGDQFQCGAVIYNYDQETASIKVTAQASGVLELTAKPQHIQVDKGAAKEVFWPCQAVKTGTAQVIFTAKSSNETDAVESRLAVTDIEKKQTLAVYSATKDTETQVLQKPAAINTQVPNEVSVSMASTALLNLRGGMLYLLTYPYDCLEQKMSKILPIIEGAQLVEDFHLAEVSEYKTKTQEILQEIPSYQHVSGGLAYWPGAQPDPYVTAYTLETAYRAQQAGYRVPAESLKKAIAWLKNSFSGKLSQAYPYSSQETHTARAYAVYVLALYGENLDGQFANLYAQRHGLTPAAQAYLLQAARVLKKGPEIEQALAQQLLNLAQYGAQTIHFAAGGEQPWLHIENVTTTALALEALLQTGNYLQQPYQVVRWLIEQLNAQGHWNNTSTNAAVFCALNTYYKLHESAEPNFKASVSANGKNLLSEHFKGRNLETQQAVWPFAQVYTTSDQTRFELSKTGVGTLYYTLAQSYAPSAYVQPVNAGFAVERQLTDLQGNAVSVFRAGERYKVTLTTITSQAYSFVVLEDFIPAGFEIVNTELATESQTEAAVLKKDTWGGFERNEKYEDRIAIFADYLTAGTHEYSYLVQTTVAGQYSYPSAWVSQMYDPAVFGRNATSSVVIEP